MINWHNNTTILCAKKPDFIQLAKAIVDELTSNPESQSRMHLEQLKKVAKDCSVIMPIDHLFSLLFSTSFMMTIISFLLMRQN
jgi:hypothetical protein